MDAAQRVSASCTPNIAEALDGTFENPSHEVMVETLGVTLCVAKRILAWHTKAAVRKAEKIEDLQSFTTCAVG
jgi:hypothetical protein